MAADSVDPIFPLSGRRPIDPGEKTEAGPAQPGGITLVGTVVSMRRPRHGGQGGHRLDVSVGAADEHLEIVIRVDPGAYPNIEGRQAVIHIEE